MTVRIFGKLNSFSRGKIHAHDEGDLQMGIANKDGVVIINFGTPVTWIGLEPDKAEAFAALITKHAKEIRSKAQ